MSEAAEPDLRLYPHFNAFFTRALAPGARCPDSDPRTILMPADGHISQLGNIAKNSVLQAKGHSFTLEALLGDADDAQPFYDGLFVTIYLSPRDYHRVHMPWTATLRKTRHVPGRLFSVSPASVQTIPRVFARNERLICHFDADFGPFAVIMVGALLVSGVETVWGGQEIPPYGTSVHNRQWTRGSHRVCLERFAQLGQFNYGSSVIILLPKGSASFASSLTPFCPVRVGAPLAHVLSPSSSDAPG